MTREELYQLLDNSIPIPYSNPRQILDKERSIKQYMAYMLDRTNSMFEYDNLPETIPAYMLELYLQIFGSCAFVELSESNTQSITIPETYNTPSGLYIFYGNIGGERDIYYRPTQFIVANPRLKNSINCSIVYSSNYTNSFNNPCVVMRNDTNYMGLLPLFSRYAAQLAENDISIRSAQINARSQTGIAVGTDADAESARKYFDDLEAGKIGIIGRMSFLEGITISNMGTQSANHIIQLIELQQYLKASWYNELGLNVNFNMKREYMSEEEIAVNTDILLPLVDDMLKCREEAVELINATFGTNISVYKSSAWANKEQEELAALSESSNKGEIPLKDSIQSRINKDAPNLVTTKTDHETEVQEQIQSKAQTSEQSNNTDSGESMGENGTGEVGNVNESNAEVPKIEINIDTQSAEVIISNDVATNLVETKSDEETTKKESENVSESKSQEKSEESDNN